MSNPATQRALPLVLLAVLAMTACGQDASVEPQSGPTHAPMGWLMDDVQPGDVLVSINGQAVKSRDDAIHIMEGLDRNATTVEVVLDRRGKLITLNVDRAPR